MEKETGAEDLPTTADVGGADDQRSVDKTEKSGGSEAQTRAPDGEQAPATKPPRKPSTPRKSAARPKAVPAVSGTRPAPEFGDLENPGEAVADTPPRKPAARKPAARTTAQGAAAKKTAGQAKAPRAAPKRATAPKPASQAAAVVAAAQTLADRQRVTREILGADDSPSTDESRRDESATAPARTARKSPTTPRAAQKRPSTPSSGQTAPEVVAADATSVAPTEDAIVDDTAVDVTAIANDPTVDDTAVDHTAVEGRAVDDTALDHTAVEGRAVDDAAVEDTAVQAQPVEVDERARDAAASSTPSPRDTVLVVEGLTKSFGGTLAVDQVDLTVRAGSIFGIVGPNGAGKTTTLSMVTGLLRPDSGRVLVHGADVWKDPEKAKRNMGVLPDRLRLFDRLTGGQLLFYSGSLRGLDRATVKSRSRDLAVAFGLEDALSRLVTDYSAGMTKKIALAAAMIHSPRVLILDEPFEAVDPVSAANVIEILQKYAAAGGTVVMSSHSMDLIQRICDSVTIIVRGEVLASGTMEQVRNGSTLEDRFVELAGGRKAAEGMEWLHSFSA